MYLPEHGLDCCISHIPDLLSLNASREPFPRQSFFLSSVRMAKPIFPVVAYILCFCPDRIRQTVSWFGFAAIADVRSDMWGRPSGVTVAIIPTFLSRLKSLHVRFSKIIFHSMTSFLFSNLLSFWEIGCIFVFHHIFPCYRLIPRP